MNYRHHFHAGNAGDVLKHLVLVLLLQHLRRKPAPFCVLDTHAGRGLYDLAGAAATRTGEHLDGIGRLWGWREPPPGIAEYLEVVARVHGAAEGPLRHYPGSPTIARALLRPQDRLILCELHPEEHAALRLQIGRDPQVAVHHMDGYQGIRAFLPPKERRGLVLVDPPFERGDELAAAVAALVEGHRRFAGGIFAIWYPIKGRATIREFEAALRGSGIPKVLAVELLPYPDDRPDRLGGSGMVIVGPPYRLDEALRGLLPALAGRLDHRDAGEAPGRWRVEWLVGESG
ncbi:MAG: 23S rRNA (adenine(2030)-N(6))-methyltransferase RlmJ [Nannocystaceae bacterium]